MVIQLIKFIHVLMALGLLGLTSYGIFAVQNTKQSILCNKSLLILSGMAMMTGTLLIYPLNFSLHTPWIRAAYLFLFIYSVSLGLLILFKEKITKILYWQVTYIFLIFMLILITHDAVTKKLFLI